MLSRRSSSVPLLVLVASILNTACDATGPDEPTIEELTVSGIRVDADRFRSSGEFELGLLALDDRGESILTDAVTVSATLSPTPGGGPSSSIGFQGVTAHPASSSSTSASILLDDSGSMAGNDRTDMRAEAARLFWEAVLPVRSNNQVALLDFGAGRTDGFNYTRLLQGWTRDEQALTAALDLITASGGTPLYESIQESAVWADTSSVTAGSERVMLVLTDGRPNGVRGREAAIDATIAAGITLHTVGLGPASDLAMVSDPDAVAAVRELAQRTGGVYSAATDADALRPIFQTLAQVSGEGQLVGAFQISPPPPTGTRLQGTVTVSSGNGSATASWSFVAP